MQHYRSRRGNSFQERDSEGRFASNTNGRRYNNEYNEEDRNYRDQYNRRPQYEDDSYNSFQQNRDGRYYDRYDQGDYNNQYNNEYNHQYNRTNEGYRDYDDFNRRDYYDYNRNEDLRHDQDHDRRGPWSQYQNGSNGHQNNRDWDRGGSHQSNYSHRGFESMPRSEVRRIAAMGGRASHGGGRGGRVSSRRHSRSSR